MTYYDSVSAKKKSAKRAALKLAPKSPPLKLEGVTPGRAERINGTLRDPVTREATIREISAALDRAGGSPGVASKMLGVYYRTFSRWVARDEELRNRLSAVRLSHGQPAFGQGPGKPPDPDSVSRSLGARGPKRKR